MPPLSSAGHRSLSTTARRVFVTAQSTSKDHSEFTVHPTVGDPTIGFNSIFCTIKEVATGSPVIPTGCKIGSGYHPDAQIVFVNK